MEALDECTLEPYIVTELSLALAQAIRSYLPNYISAWIDERASDTADINVLIRDAIQDEADFVIFFLRLDAMKPEGVKRECEWALERGKFRSNNA